MQQDTIIDHERPEWPKVLPPPLPGEIQVGDNMVPLGELEIDRKLVGLIRNGSMPLEDEDALVQECIDVWQAHVRQGDPIYWTAPPKPTEVDYDPNYQVGYELFFIKSGPRNGQPVSILLLTTGQAENKELFTKEIPRRHWRPRLQLCSLSRRSPRYDEYWDMGFEACAASGFNNRADWFEHMNKCHPGFVESMGGFTDHAKMEALYSEAQQGAQDWVSRRRSQDPRLREALRVTDNPATDG